VRLAAVVDRHRVLAFVVVAYAVSWSCWFAWSAVDGPPVLQTMLFVAGGFGPFVAGGVVTVATGERVRAWLGRIFHWRAPAWTYAFALALPVAAVGLAGLVHWQVLDGALTPDLLPSPLEYPIYLAFVLLLGGGFEEPGWRGFMLPALQRERSSLAAALLVGVVWAAWHAPLFVLQGAVQNDVAPWLYVPQVVAISVVLTWVTNASDGSVLPAMVLHAGANAVANFYPVGGDVGALSTTGYGLLAAVVVVAAVLVTVRDGAALRATDRKPSQTSD
jgi:membrane protease YdiL (CAAX protease family)